MPKEVISIQGGTTTGSPVHSDFPGYIEKTEQANGRVPFKVTSHMTGNNTEGIEGGIDIKGKDTGGIKTDYHR